MPRPENVERALNEIRKGYAQYSYFFDNLNSLTWIEPLADKGLFKHPPEPVRQDNTISYSYWPESRYLVRMAAIPAAQDAVVNVVLKIPETTNIRVHLDIVEIALALPPRLAAQLLPKTKEWFRIARHLLLPQKIGVLISHLADGGEADVALTLTRRALQLSPDKEQKDKGDEEIFLPKPQTLFQDWDYEQIIATVLPSLSKAAGLKTIRLFCELLNEAIRLSNREPDESDEDFLYISHELIGDTPQFHQATSVLICAVRDSSVMLIDQENEKFSAVIDELRKWKWKTFRRLELYLCRLFPTAGLTRTEEFFSEPEKLEDASLQHEAVLLLKEVFPQLSHATRQRTLEWIDNGPPDHFKEWIRKAEGTTEAEVESYIQRWRRDHLAVLEGVLPDEYAKKYSDLVEASGPANRIDARATRGGGAYAPPAPKTAEELVAMDIQGVIDFLGSWQPKEGFFEANQEGLARQLAPLITADPSRYVGRALDFRFLDPTYVRALFEGLTGALKAGSAFDWEQPLDLARWVVNQDRAIPGRKGDYFVADPDWGWTRNSIVELIREGFVERTGRIPITERGRVWSVLAPLTKDTDPEHDREQKENPDHAFLAINSTRGRAIDLAIDYAAWVMTSDDDIKGKAEKSFDAIPEVQEVLEEHLDVVTDPLLAIRSLYGKNFRQLAGLDLNWLEANAEKIFPVSTDAAKYFQAAWESFVVFNQPHSKLLKTFRWVYEKAADNLGKIKPCMKSPDSPDDRFGDHLITYYWWGEITLQDGLLERFLLNSPESARSHIMWYIAHSAKECADAVPAEVLERLMKFFEHRLETAEKQRADGLSITEVEQELSSFGFWFTCQKFPEDWSISTLVRVVKLTKRIEPSMTVLQELPKFSEKYPVQCMRVINDLAEGKNEDWLFVGVESESENVLKAALKSGTPAIVQEARHVINQLIARGHSRFRHLLKE